MQILINDTKRLSTSVLITLGVFCLLGWISSPLALLAGILLALTLGNPFKLQTKKFVAISLKIAVVGLGFGLNFQDAWEATRAGLSFIVPSIIGTVVVGLFFGKIMKVPFKTTYLIAIGTAICGGSAIAAVAPAIKASEKNITVSLAVVFILNALALFLFPFLGQWFLMNQADFGLWVAIAIHDTSSVVGAAQAFGNEALGVATTVKLSRALWIVPISLLSVLFAKDGRERVTIPWFIFLFVAAVLLNEYIHPVISETLFFSAKRLLILTLLLLGTGLSLDQLRSAGMKPIALGTSLWVLVSVLSLLAILNF